jgi:hypothetical protein
MTYASQRKGYGKFLMSLSYELTKVCICICMCIKPTYYTRMCIKPIYYTHMCIKPTYYTHHKARAHHRLPREASQRPGQDLLPLLLDLRAAEHLPGPGQHSQLVFNRDHPQVGVICQYVIVIELDKMRLFIYIPIRHMDGPNLDF